MRGLVRRVEGYWQHLNLVSRSAYLLLMGLVLLFFLLPLVLAISGAALVMSAAWLLFWALLTPFGYLALQFYGFLSRRNLRQALLEALDSYRSVSSEDRAPILIDRIEAYQEKKAPFPVQSLAVLEPGQIDKLIDFCSERKYFYSLSVLYHYADAQRQEECFKEILENVLSKRKDIQVFYISDVFPNLVDRHKVEISREIFASLHANTKDVLLLKNAKLRQGMEAIYKTLKKTSIDVRRRVVLNPLSGQQSADRSTYLFALVLSYPSLQLVLKRKELRWFAREIESISSWWP